MLVRVAWIALWLGWSVAPGLTQPSWCKYARTETERTICSTQELWPVDACEDRLFRDTREALPAEHKRLDAEERGFDRERDRCGKDLVCIARRYAARAAVFDAPGREPCVALANTAAAALKSKAAQAQGRCNSASLAEQLAGQVSVMPPASKASAYGEPIPVAWSLPQMPTGGHRAYLIGALPDGVRFEGRYRFDDTGGLTDGPGFVALTAGARAPFDLTFGQGQVRVVIPVHDTDVPRTGGLSIKPFVSGPLVASWALAVVSVGCGDAKAPDIAIRPLDAWEPIEVGVGRPEIVVQDFAPPTPQLELATAVGTQKLQQVEISADGRYRLEVFERRYRVFDRSTGAKLTDRSGVQPRFSPGGRFVVASIGDATLTYPTEFEVFDLLAGRVVAQVDGPIVGWSNGDALLLDGRRTYQSLGIFNTLIDPVRRANGPNANWPTFSPGCSTCDPWIGSNVVVDWDQLTVLRGDDGAPSVKGIASLAGGRLIDVIELDEDAKDLRAYLRRTYGKTDVRLAKGWSSPAGLELTHVGRGYNGYTDDDDGLTPEDKDRVDQRTLLLPRRLALADGQVLAVDDLKSPALGHGESRAAWRGPPNRRGAVRIEAGYVADELAKLDVFLLPTRAVEELVVPIVAQPGGNDPLVRTWPDDLRREILEANPSLTSWFEKGPDDIQEKIVIAAWRFEIDGTAFLLLQHGEPAPTAAGAHDLRFDLVALSGPERGKSREITAIGGLFSQFIGRDHAVGRVFISHESRLTVVVPSLGKGAVVDLQSEKIETLDVPDPTLVCGVLEAPARGLVVQSNCDGQMFVFAPARGPEPILGGRVQDEELILYTASGYYAATYEGAHFVHIGFPGRPGVHSFEQFAKVLDRPDVVKSVLEGRGEGVPPPRLSPPPIVTAARAESTAGQSAFTLSARSDSGLAAIEVHLDGQLVEQIAVDGRSVERTLDMRVPPHARRLTVVAIDTDGFRSRPATVVLPVVEPVANTLHVVAVGVDTYRMLDPLKGAATDARTLVRTLGARTPYYGSVRSRLLVDTAVSASALQREVEAAVAQASSDDTLLFFYAGHGARTDDGRFYMTTPATDPDRLPETGIDWQAISNALGRAKGRVIVVIDACHSGQTGRATTNDEAISSLAETGGAPLVIFAASKGRQLSEELDRKKGGVFTQTLARLLAGRGEADVDGDGTLSVSEIYGGVKRAVELQTEGRQTPWIVRRNFVGDAPLF